MKKLFYIIPPALIALAGIQIGFSFTVKIAVQLKKECFYLLVALFFFNCSSKQLETSYADKITSSSDTLPDREIKIQTKDSLEENENYSPIPDLNDEIILCRNGALPYYVSCNDTAIAKKLFYSNGKLMCEGEIKNGKRNGPWVSYYNNSDSIKTKQQGGVCAKGMFINDFPIGKWLFYYSNGNKKAEGEFANGKFELGCAGSNNFIPASIQSGRWKFWRDDGTLNITCAFSSDEFGLERLNGTYTEWFFNGNKKCEGNFRNGSKNNKWTFWYENGNKKREEFYKYKDCELEEYASYECPAGIWTYWKKDGGILKTEKYFNGKKQE